MLQSRGCRGSVAIGGAARPHARLCGAATAPLRSAVQPRRRSVSVSAFVQARAAAAAALRALPRGRFCLPSISSQWRAPRR
jgi:hypothetical protein